MSYKTDHLHQLEAEAIYVIREAAGQLERPVLLFSGGKDSIVLATLAERAFHPGIIPFPLMHIDTGHNFPETLAFRDSFCERIGAKLIVRSVEDSIRAGRATEERGPLASRNALQTVTLLDAIREFSFDGALGGARRDEEKARAKERFFSFRDAFGQWDPKNQRPELWRTYNAQRGKDEHFRIFPLSNWTELDIWQFILSEEIELPSLYFSHEREVFEQDGVILAVSPHAGTKHGDPRVTTRSVRFRTIGDVTCTGATESPATTVEQIVEEVAATRTTERGGRADDRRSEAAMEDRKRGGYF